MDIFAIIGLLLGFTAVVGGQILEGGSVMAIVQPTAFIIVMGGSVGATMLSMPPEELKAAIGNIMMIFGGVKIDPKGMIKLIMDLATKARKEGILALQADIEAIDDEFMKKGLELMTDGTDPQLLRDILETEIGIYEEEMGGAAKVWETTGGYTPTVGIIGAVLGLIHVMENLNDPSKLGSGIAVAFVATVYGVAFANLIFIPMGSNVKFKAKHVVHMRTMIVEGIMAIQAGESPNFIEQKLAVFYPHEAKALQAETT